MFDAIRTIYNIIEYIKVQQMHGLYNGCFQFHSKKPLILSAEHSYYHRAL